MMLFDLDQDLFVHNRHFFSGVPKEGGGKHISLT